MWRGSGLVLLYFWTPHFCISSRRLNLQEGLWSSKLAHIIKIHTFSFLVPMLRKHQTTVDCSAPRHAHFFFWDDKRKTRLLTGP